MKSLSDIQDGLKGFAFISYPHAIRSLLSALGLPESTALRLSQLAEEDSNSPIYVYRKAVLLYTLENSVSFIESLILPYKGIPLAIVFTPNGMFIRKANQVITFYSHTKIWEHVDEFDDSLTYYLVDGKRIYENADPSLLPHVKMYW